MRDRLLFALVQTTESTEDTEGTEGCVRDRGEGVARHGMKMTKLDYATPTPGPKRDLLFYVANFATMAPGVLMLMLLFGAPNGPAPGGVRILSLYMIVVQLAVGSLTVWRRRHLWGLAATSLGLHVLNLLLSSTVARGSL